MATTTKVNVKDLHLDLTNFRTVRQKNEINAINAMIIISPDNFWALMHSLLDDGYLPTENIIVLKDSKDRNIVKEGNRRIACLKIIFGYLDNTNFLIPTEIVEKIKNISDEWKKENEKVPCTIYNLSEAKKADKIVALAHGKGEKAGRDKWESVATARHNRAMGNAEPSLDLLEKYLVDGKNLTNLQKERWAGNYSLTVLHEALMKIFPRLKFLNVKELVAKYPSLKERDALEEIMLEIGVKHISFPALRDPNSDVLAEFGIPPLPAASSSFTPASGSVATKAAKKKAAAKKTAKGTISHPIADPKTVKETLKQFQPKGQDRQKIATLREEALALKLENNPIAFCFLLRSMFEISAKIYCEEHKIPLRKIKEKDGKKNYYDKSLLELLKDVTNHLTDDKKDKLKTQRLHGAITELGKSDGLLSVTSMNQLVHNPKFAVTSADICTLFGRVYSLLEFMN